MGRGILVESSRHLKPWRSDVKAAAEAAVAAGLGGRFPLDGLITARMVFTLARPLGHYRTGRNAHLLRNSAPSAPGTMPDLSKLLRATEDALTDAGVWTDDARVVEYDRLAKVYPLGDPESLEIPGVRIAVRVISKGGK